MDEVEIAIIGAGVVGLAIAKELSVESNDIVVIDARGGYGRETSSRSSEVIHSGIYYQPGSLKALTCVEGASLLFDYCRNNSIPYKRTGKLIVSSSMTDEKELECLYKRGLENGVRGLELLQGEDVRRLEPNVISGPAIYSPETGIIDTHSLMDSLYRESIGSGVVFSFNTEVCQIEHVKNGYVIGVKEDNYRFIARRLINSAGLASDHIAELAGIDVDGEGYRLEYRKGSYFSYQAESPVKSLVYPMPSRDIKSLGVHATVNLNGRLRFGPDTELVKEVEYGVNADKMKEFFKCVSKYIKGLDMNSFSPDMAGIRPSLSGEGFKDFIIRHESDRGMNGLINLIGIDSPGLTASLSIGKYVRTLLKEMK